MAKREWMTEDFGWKLFSVFLAVVIWITVHKIREEPEASVAFGDGNTYGDVPVGIVSATADVHDVRVVPNKVDVKVSGPPDIMETLQANRIHVFVNLTGIDSAHDLQRPVEVSLPRGVTLVSVDPPQIIVTIPKKQ
jgi:YbbR domain-containing protein